MSAAQKMNIRLITSTTTVRMDRRRLSPRRLQTEGLEAVRELSGLPTVGRQRCHGQLVSVLAQLPADVTIWLRIDPGAGRQRTADFQTQLAECELDLKAQILLVDAHLAPDREGALFVCAGWSGPMTLANSRRSSAGSDCGCTVFRTSTEMVAWATASQG